MGIIPKKKEMPRYPYRPWGRPPIQRSVFKKPKAHPQYAQEAINYGSMEADRGLNWINGKRICRKVVNIGALPNASSKTVAHGIKKLGDFVRIRGVCKNGSNYLPMPYADTAATGTQIELYADATNVVIVTGTDRSGDTGVVVLEFTKS